jgi:hypothetical protein
MTYFEKKSLNQVIGKLWMDFSAETHFLHKLFFEILQYYSGHKNIVQAHHFHILTIDGDYRTVHNVKGKRFYPYTALLMA